MLKLVKESLNEFGKGQDPMSTLNIGGKIEMKKFMQDIEVPDDDYIIKDNIVWFKQSVVLLSHLDLTIFPYNLYVSNHLYMIRCKNLSQLPEEITVELNMYLRECDNLSQLPNKLKVGGDLYIIDCIKLYTIPETADIRGDIIVTRYQQKLIKFLENSKFANQFKIH